MATPTYAEKFYSSAQATYVKGTPNFEFFLSGWNDVEHRQLDDNWLKADDILGDIQSALVALGGGTSGEIFLDGGTF